MYRPSPDDLKDRPPRISSDLWGFLVVAVLVCGCGGAGHETYREESRGRTVHIQRGNLLAGTPAAKPVWANPGLYSYDAGTREFFVELRLRSNNTAMKLRSATLVIDGDPVELRSCSAPQSRSEYEGNTKVYEEYLQCIVGSSTMRSLGASGEVRVQLAGEGGVRSAYFSKANRKQVRNFLDEVRKAE